MKVCVRAYLKQSAEELATFTNANANMAVQAQSVMLCKYMSVSTGHNISFHARRGIQGHKVGAPVMSKM